MAIRKMQKRFFSLLLAALVFCLAAFPALKVSGEANVLIVELTKSVSLEKIVTDALSKQPSLTYTSLKITGGQGFVIENQDEEDSEAEYYNGAFLDDLLPDVSTVDFSSFEGDCGEYTLASASYVEKVILQQSQVLVKGMFYNCYSLNTVGNETGGTIDLSACASLGEEAFNNCFALTKVKLPQSANIPSKLFAGCYNLTAVGDTEAVIDLSDCASLGEYAFVNCITLTKVILPPDTLSLAKGIFNNCKSLATIGTAESIVDLSAISLIGEHAFSGCSAITNVKLAPSSQIGDSAFLICSSLKTVGDINNVVDLGSCAPAIGGSAFLGCESIEKLYLPANAELSFATFNGCSALSAVGETAAGMADLRNCASYGEYAFGNTAVSGLILSSDKDIGKYAFAEMPHLKHVLFNGTKPNIDENAFYISPPCYILSPEKFNDLSGLPDGSVYPSINKGEYVALVQGGSESLAVNGMPAAARCYWQKDGNDITGSHSESHSLTDFKRSADGGKYRCTVSIGEINYTTDACDVLEAVANDEFAAFSSPVNGAVPVSSFGSAAGSFSGAVTWSPADSLFQSSTVYTAHVALQASEGYGFPADFQPQGGSGAISNLAVSSNGKEASFKISYPATREKAPVAIEIFGQPDKLSYIYGEKFDFNGLSVALVYDDESWEIISPEAYTIDTENILDENFIFNTGHSGKIIRISYGGYTADTNAVAVEPKKLTIKANDADVKKGSAMPQFTYSVVGDFIGGDDFITEPVLSCGENTGTEGVYEIVPSGADGGANYTFTYETGRLTVYGLGAQSLIEKITSPAGALLKGDEISADVAADVSSLVIAANTGPGAQWRLYSDAGCGNEIADKTMVLAQGENTAYIKVVSEDGAKSKIYTIKITRKANLYSLSIINGKDINENRGSYEGAARIEIKADAAPEGKVFDKWESDSGSFVNFQNSETVFIMPERNAVVKAVYKSTAPAVLNDTLNGIMLTGSFTHGAAVKVENGKLALHKEKSCKACDDIRLKEQQDIFEIYNVSVEGKYTGKLKLIFNVGEIYNGRKFLVVHCDNGRADEKILTVENGIIAAEFESLSPFTLFLLDENTAVANSSAKKETAGNFLPQTGDNANLPLWFALMAASFISLAFTLCLKLKQGGKKEK